MGRFDALSDLDFEEVVADVLRASTGLQFRAGTRGPDRGVDVLAWADLQRHVVQCKHIRTGQGAEAVREARREAVRLASTGWSSTSYRFVTSARLSHVRRDEIATILQPWIGDVSHVLGEGDLEALLRAHPAVEARHVKLWLGGAGALRRALHAGVYERSRALLEETRAALPRYVQTDAFFEARDLLHNRHVCVIAGPPGVGKTTLARLLMIDGLEQGYQPYDIPQGGLHEAWDLLDRDERQLFFYDDFLGRISLVPGQEDDEHLMRFMRDVARSPTTRIVLTTREYVLRQAQGLSDVLERESSDFHRFLLLVARYDRREKARIFYNHVYFSDQVDEVARRSLLAGRAYRKVIDHHGYSPRLIEWMTGAVGGGLDEAGRRDFATYCVDVLDHPERLWQRAFDRGLDEVDKILLLCLVSMPDGVRLCDLEQAFTTACAAAEIVAHGRRFQTSLKVLHDSFVTSHSSGEDIEISAINPSLLDFLTAYVTSSRADAERLLAGAHFFEQVAWLWTRLSEAVDGRPAGEPPADLVPAFARAFDATFDSVVPTAGLTILRRGHGPAGSRLARFDLLLSWMEHSPSLLEHADTWLERYADEWASCEIAEDLSPMTLHVVDGLIAVGALAQDTWLEVKRLILMRDGEMAESWMLIVELSRLVPDIFDRDEWQELQRRFVAYSDRLLSGLDAADDDGYFDLDELQQIAASLGIRLDDEAVEHAEEQLMRMGADPEMYWDAGEDRLDRMDDLREDGDDDAHIDAMFERLGED